MDVDYLRGALREDAQLVGTPEPDLYERVRQGRQRADRHRLSYVAAGLAALLIGVAIPLSLMARDVGDDSGQVAAPSGAEIPNASGIPGILGLPTRGSLADDPEFLDQVRQLPWAVPGLSQGADPGYEIPNPPIETRHVVFAGDVAQGRWALVAGQPDADSSNPDVIPPGALDPGDRQQTPAAWFGGPLGATADQMQPVNFPAEYVANLPASLYDSTTGTLVIVSAPGDVIEISPRPEVSADGTVSRDFAPATMVDGVAVAAVEPSPYGLGFTAVQYRVTRDGDQVAVGQTPVPYGYVEEPVFPTIELDYPDGVPADQTGLTQRMAADILGNYGLRPDEVELTVHFSGAVPGTDPPASLAVLTATFPSGAVLTRADWIEGPTDGSIGPYFTCASEVSAAGSPAAEGISAFRCDTFSELGTEPLSRLVVLVPQSLASGSAVAVRTSDPLTLEFADDRVAVGEFNEGMEGVMIYAADGSLVAEVPIFMS